MMEEIRKYQISILGETYTLLSDESEKAIMEVVSLVNSLMRETAEKSLSTDTKKTAVLVALKIASKMISLEKKHHQIIEMEGHLIRIIESVTTV